MPYSADINVLIGTQLEKWLAGVYEHVLCMFKTGKQQRHNAQHVYTIGAKAGSNVQAAGGCCQENKGTEQNALVLIGNTKPACRPSVLNTCWNRLARSRTGTMPQTA